MRKLTNLSTQAWTSEQKTYLRYGHLMDFRDSGVGLRAELVIRLGIP